MKAKIPRAINTAARMEVADNTGARIVEVISVLKYRGVRTDILAAVLEILLS